MLGKSCTDKNVDKPNSGNRRKNNERNENTSQRPEDIKKIH